MREQTFIIVGASVAGAKAAEELRTAGFDGRVLLIRAERELPYERPPLTKDYLRGESPRERAYEVGMEYSGHAPGWDEVVFRGDPVDGEFWLREQRLVAGMNVNVWDVNEHV